jgi:hypothetical protein
MPSEIMLSLGRICEIITNYYRPKQVENKDGTKRLEWTAEQRTEFKEFVRLAAECCGKAAPYMEQRLSSFLVTHRHPDLTKLSDDELDTIEAALDRVSDAPGGADGEVETRH